MTGIMHGRIRLSVAALLTGCGVAAGLWGWTRHRVDTHIYTSSDFGGYVGANLKHLPDTQIQRASEALTAGRYAEAEQIATSIIGLSTSAQPNPNPFPGRSLRLAREGANAASPSHRLTASLAQNALLARRILAYSSARQNRFAEAKLRFGALRQAAYESPDHGVQRVPVGDVAPTLEEEGAFQQAVCTSALGDKRAAEAELDGFMRDYPRSILVHAAVKRIGRMHGGDVPKDAETTWKQAMAIQKAADEKDRRDQALCGPECLAEMLRRGVLSHKDAKTQRNAIQEVVDVPALAQEMNTTGDGSTVAAMVRTAAKHGLKLEGVSLTTKGLMKQQLPIIALIAPGHYVVVESINHSPTSPLTLSSVSAWDPDAKGTGNAGQRTFTAVQWEKAWEGVALR